MDSSFREHGSGRSQAPKSFLAGLHQILTSFIQWLAGLITLTEEEQEATGIYVDRLGDE